MRFVFWPAIALDLVALGVALYFAIDAAAYRNSYGELVLLGVSIGLLALIGGSIAMWRGTKRAAALVLALVPAIPVLLAGGLLLLFAVAGPASWR